LQEPFFYVVHHSVVNDPSVSVLLFPILIFQQNGMGMARTGKHNCRDISYQQLCFPYRIFVCWLVVSITS